MFEVKNNYLKKRDISIPLVEFNPIELSLEFGELFNNSNIWYLMGLILLRLGFIPKDNIVISSYDKNNHTFNCVVNDKDVYMIRIANNGLEIVVSRYNLEYGYVCEEDGLSEIGMKISLGRYRVQYPNGLIFTRYLSRDKMIFKIEQDDCVFELVLDKPNDMVIPLFENGCYAKYRLDNEANLVEYLCSLSFSDSLADVYKKICSTYIDDISKYPVFSLKKSRKMNNGEYKDLDLILLNNGNMNRFGMTVDGKTIFIDKDDNWVFDMSSPEDRPIDVRVAHIDGKMKCEFALGEDLDLIKYTSEMISLDVDKANSSAINAKKRARELFGNRKG